MAAHVTKRSYSAADLLRLKENGLTVPLFINDNNNCFQASLVMLLHFYRIAYPKLKWGVSVSDDPSSPFWTDLLSDLIDPSPTGVECTPREIELKFENLRKRYGVPVKIRRIVEHKVAGMPQLKRFIDFGMPFIAHVDIDNYLFASEDSTYAHSVVVTGYSESVITTSDPARRRDFQIPREEFKRIWSRKSYMSCFLLPLGSRVREIKRQSLIEDYYSSGASP